MRVRVDPQIPTDFLTDESGPEPLLVVRPGVMGDLSLIELADALAPLLLSTRATDAA